MKSCEQPDGSSAQPSPPRPEVLKWVFLFFGVTITTGSYYQFQLSSVLKEELKKIYKLDDIQFNQLYSYPQILNILVCVFTGVLINKVGPKLVLKVFICLLFLGSLMYSIASIIGNYWMTLAALLVFQPSLDSINIVQCTHTLTHRAPSAPPPNRYAPAQLAATTD